MIYFQQPVDFLGKRPGCPEEISVRPSAPTLPAPTEPEGPSDYEAFVQLYLTTIRTVSWRLFRLRVREPEKADAMQENYLEAWRGWNTHNPGLGRREQWLYGITVNVAARFRERRALKAQREEPQFDDFDSASQGRSLAHCASDARKDHRRSACRARGQTAPNERWNRNGAASFGQHGGQSGDGLLRGDHAL